MDAIDELISTNQSISIISVATLISFTIQLKIQPSAKAAEFFPVM